VKKHFILIEQSVDNPPQKTAAAAAMSSIKIKPRGTTQASYNKGRGAKTAARFECFVNRILAFVACF
jgi:hypothetical protein